MVLLLRFNQPVSAADIAAALSASLTPHDWTPPSFTPEALQRLKSINPSSIEQFNAKVNAVRGRRVLDGTGAVQPDRRLGQGALPAGP